MDIWFEKTVRDVISRFSEHLIQKMNKEVDRDLVKKTMTEFLKKRQKCSALTATGTSCSKYAIIGCETCVIHSHKKQPREKRSGGSKKTDKKPVHTHSIDERDDTCELCKIHGRLFEIPEYEEDFLDSH